MQLLWFRCKPLGYCQAGLEMHQLHDRMPPLQAPILTNMVVPASVASVASVLMCYGSRLNRSTSSGLLICAVPFACAACHHLQAQADDVTALWSAALTASRRADWLWR